MIHQITILIILLSVILIVGQVFNKSSLPISLLLVITGMILSLVPGFPRIELNPNLVLNVFLPLLIYQISAFSSWKDIRKNMNPIAMLSIGHVIFITILVAVVMHALIPELSWPLAFVLGAVISPPDDVAIISIGEKIRMPAKIVTVLEGEGLLNDATALVLFRLFLAAIVTHEFSVLYASSYLFIDILCEVVYGFILGTIIGAARLKITNQNLGIIASFITPFLAYLPPEMLGGSGVIATVVTGMVIGQRYSVRFTPQFRLFSFSLWPTLSYVIQCLLYLLVGLDLRYIYENIAPLSTHSLLLYSTTVVLTVIIGRFIWVYVTLSWLPWLLLKLTRKRTRHVPWQYPFIISWAGMRGAISLAAALAVPTLPAIIEGVNPKNLLVFLVFCVITVTFVLQGLTLPWLLKKIGADKRGQREEYDQHLGELAVRRHLAKVVLRWLTEYEDKVKEDEKLLKEVKLYIREYRMLKTRLKERIAQHDGTTVHDEAAESMTEAYLLSKIIAIEREEVVKLWREEKINNYIRNKLLERLDHRTEHARA